MARDWIRIKGAHLHNLKKVDLAIPKASLVAFTGVSGSGKSTLAFDLLHKEGQRQYLESLGFLTYQLGGPKAESIEGLSPSISVEQHLTNRSPRSTVGTATEVYTYLRVLYARVGHRPCERCGADVPPPHDASLGWEAEVASEDSGPGPELAGETYPCPSCGAPTPVLSMAHFSFNKPAGACPRCTGLGTVHQVLLSTLIDETKSLRGGAVRSWDAHLTDWYTQALAAAGKHYGLPLDLDVPFSQLPPAQRDLVLYGAESEGFRRHFPAVPPPKTVRSGRFEGIVTAFLRRYAERVADAAYREKMERHLEISACPECQGRRLKAAVQRVQVAGKTIVEAVTSPLTELRSWVEGLLEALPPDDRLIAAPIVEDLVRRLGRLEDVGVGYLTLGRATTSLSAGEAQRLRLASLLGSGLTGVLYVLDEPTVGLHPQDTERLIRALRQLRDLGNTVLVVEHDLRFLEQADYLVDLGPGAGRFGGRVVASGTPAEVKACPASLTGGYLAGRLAVSPPRQRREGRGESLVIRGAREHNLKNLTVRLPLGTLTAITGPSGSGKSTLIFDILERAARRRFSGGGEPPGHHDGIDGWEHLSRVISIDQLPIGRVPRSNVATYCDVFTAVRDLYAGLPEARQRGLGAGHFSFNVPGGRCERCQGAGTVTIPMHFLPDVYVTCPVCRGRRFRPEVLAVRYRGYDVSQVLDMTIEEAQALFADTPPIANRLGVLVEVGLGYLQLGQPATTLSGGEAQRVKLAKELGRKGSGRGLYLLDEPTTGLHPHDVARLLGVLQRLVDQGNTVIVVEHNLDVIRAADWVIDLGPGGGADGGRVVAEGTPEMVAQAPASVTGRYL
ncbi:MAG: excinuclease ABC subunit UvrA [Betaproteobacteria bacterium]